MEKLLEKQKTLMISSLDSEGNAKISYAPYVYMNSNFYIYISRVPDHYKNIVNNSNISIMIIEDEKDARSSFARDRAYFSANANMIEDNEDIFEAFANRHGKSTIDMLRKMDFNLFEIKTVKGRLVEGFGKAFDIIVDNGKIKLEHVVIDKKA